MRILWAKLPHPAMLLVLLMVGSGASHAGSMNTDESPIWSDPPPPPPIDLPLLEQARERSPKQALSEMRRQQVEQDLENSFGHPWAGRYRAARWSSLALSQQSGAIGYFGTGCAYSSTEIYGDVIQKADGSLEISWETDGYGYAYEGNPLKLWPVRWGNRHYLLSEEDIPRFLEAIARHVEPVAAESSSFYLMEGDQNLPVSGKPDIPHGLAEAIAEFPVRAMVTGTQWSGIDQTDDGCVETWNATINRGRDDGIRAGMRMPIRKPIHRSGAARVVSVDAQIAEVEIEVEKHECNPYYAVPEIGWIVSTGSFDEQRANERIRRRVEAEAKRQAERALQ